MNKTKLSDRMDGTRPSATMAMHARAQQLAAEGKQIYSLTAGELAAETPDYIQSAVAQKLHLNKYTPVAGLPALRSEIAANARAFYGLDWIEPRNVIVTAGSKPALYASLLSLINSGDEVIVPTPAWVSYGSLIKLAGGKVVEAPLTDDFDLDPLAVKQALSPRTKAIILNSPHNPTGAVFSEAALKALANQLRGSQVVVIADDIYAKLVYADNFTPVPRCGFERLVIVSGFSKSQALTGWRIGYVIAEQHMAQAISNLMSHVSGNAAVPSQHAGLAALERDDQPLPETLEALRRQRQLVDKALKDVPGLEYKLPAGAFYFFLNLKSITDDSADWCERLLEQTGVALVPGEAFGAPGFARLSFVTDEPTLTEALKRIKRFITKGGAK